MKKDDQLIELLTQILKVEAIQAASNKSVTEGARLLKLAGLDNQTIAEVLNTSDRKSTRLNSSHSRASRMPSSA